MVDRERNSLWVFSARKRTVRKVTRNAYENQYVATRFSVPLLSEGKEIILGVNDIEDQVVFPFDTWFTQAGCVHDGKIYYCFGLGIRIRQDRHESASMILIHAQYQHVMNFRSRFLTSWKTLLL